ncbi:hypothetical protein [Pseudoalteromonas luteoviolacea]|uniref:hypothetical protein n=1 Tax=Pseudoalteromonas luteoviolacea TaxID=43657 RepID=UPI001151F8EC|nr:hypothetical protein [Pseudoalteromonas luteoviolacea]TQF70963.1 hypothetical protein FLM44_07710 [Pseudoalteromonas luteoviolacea]
MQAEKNLVVETIGIHDESSKALIGELEKKKPNPRVGYVMVTNSAKGGDGKIKSHDIKGHKFAVQHSKVRAPAVFNTQKFPFGRYRDEAHDLAVDRGKAWFGEAFVGYKSGDSDGFWDEGEVDNWLLALDPLADGEYDTEVRTSAYRFKSQSKGSKKDNNDKCFGDFNTFLEQVSVFENEERKALHSNDPLFIYYPEPTTMYTGYARELMKWTDEGQSEGMKMIAKLANTMEDKSEQKEKLIYDENLMTSTDLGKREENLFKAYTETSKNTKRDRSKENVKNKVIENIREHDAQSSFKKGGPEMKSEYKKHGYDGE